MKMLITGVKGFMATNVAEYYLKNTKNEIVGMATDPSRLEEIHTITNTKQRYPGRFSFYPCDINNSGRLKLILDTEKPDIILNFASQADVAKSFEQPYEFYKSNLEGVVNILEWLRHSGNGTRMIQFSTEAIFAAGGSKSKEDDPMWPRNPYSASKAAAEQYIYAYNFCFNTNVQVVRPVSNFGPYQHVNKIVAKTILRCIKNEPFKLYAEPNPQKRHWMYVDDTCTAIDTIINKGDVTGTYNIAPETKYTTDEVVMRVLELLGKKELLQGYSDERLKDQEHYDMDGSKIMALGWQPRYSLDEGIKATIEWFNANPWFYQSATLQVNR